MAHSVVFAVRVIAVIVLTAIVIACTSSPVDSTDAGMVRLTNTSGGEYNPAWSPDGKRIAFTISLDKRFDVFVMNADGTNVVRLTNGPETWNSDAAWSPDGNHLAFSCGDDPFGQSDICVMNSDGTAKINLTNHEQGIGTEDPTWSPDGAQIAYVKVQGDDFRIAIMNADGSNQRIPGSSAGHDRGPAWSPDGTKIAFYSNRDHGDDIYTISPDGSNLTRLTFRQNNEIARFPAWSPDGERIAFVSERDSTEGTNFDIYVMNADGTNITRLTSYLEWDGSPSWSPDGKHIVFDSNRTGIDFSNDLYVITIP